MWSSYEYDIWDKVILDERFYSQKLLEIRNWPKTSYLKMQLQGFSKLVEKSLEAKYRNKSFNASNKFYL